MERHTPPPAFTPLGLLVDGRLRHKKHRRLLPPRVLNRALLPQRAQVFSRMVPQRHKKKHINYKAQEMFAVPQALQLWLASFAGRQVHVYCDNDAIVAALRKQIIRGNAISPLRKIAMIAALHDVQLTAQDLPALLQ
jgi:hypothetical protein